MPIQYRSSVHAFDIAKQNYGAYSTEQMKYIYDVLINRNMTFLNNYGLRYYKTQLPSITRTKAGGFLCSYLTNNTDSEFKNDFPAIGRGWMFGLKYNFRKTADTGQ